MESFRGIFLTLVIFVMSKHCCFTNTTVSHRPHPKCEEAALLLSVQEDRYEEFRDLQKAILLRLDTITTKTELSLTSTIEHSNCSSHTESVLSELSELQREVQTLGRNVESITDEPMSCADIHVKRHRFGLPLSNGVYSIYVKGTLQRVYCDLQTDGGGWTVFQRRLDADTDFFRTWNEYKHGFGNPQINYWLGNDLINLMTTESSGKQQLRVDLTDWNNTRHYIVYGSFSVSDEADRYELSVNGVISGNISDALHNLHHGKGFSTKDNFVNYGSCVDCPAYCQGAWWYGCCYYANLNGRLDRPDGRSDHELTRWYDSNSGSYVHAKHTEMKFRTVDFIDNVAQP